MDYVNEVWPLSTSFPRIGGLQITATWNAEKNDNISVIISSPFTDALYSINTITMSLAPCEHLSVILETDRIIRINTDQRPCSTAYPPEFELQTANSCL